MTEFKKGMLVAYLTAALFAFALVITWPRDQVPTAKAVSRCCRECRCDDDGREQPCCGLCSCGQK